MSQEMITGDGYSKLKHGVWADFGLQDKEFVTVVVYPGETGKVARKGVLYIRIGDVPVRPEPTHNQD